MSEGCPEFAVFCAQDILLGVLLVLVSNVESSK